MIRGCGARSDRDTRRLQALGAATRSAGTIGRIRQRPNPSHFGRIIRQIEDLAAPAHPPHKIGFQAAPDDAAAPRPAPRGCASPQQKWPPKGAAISTRLVLTVPAESAEAMPRRDSVRQAGEGRHFLAAAVELLDRVDEVFGIHQRRHARRT